MKTQTGFVAISTVLIIASVVLAIGISISLSSIGEGQSGLALYNGENTLTFTEGCMEDALLKARASSTYTGGNITRPEGICTVTVSKAGNTWTITTSTTATSYVRTIRTIISVNGYGVSLTSWNET